ncbi:hypothetical protein [Litoreibacter roseus]|uniref:Uncharacterized protein n=1 Tax=Litoreibacter roseus TaxID=2601869 RepID=A0A6N6JLN9_9RHOB|nr:hypothetical protein [Litoreibacter roseus]GFE66102.1 hypothetical protein KIN_31760 [Litoreibacter roseus]
MQRVVLSTLAATAIATGAVAYQTISQSVFENVERVLERNSFENSVTSLTDQQILEIHLAATNTDSPSDEKALVLAALDGDAIPERDFATVRRDVDGFVIADGQSAIQNDAQIYTVAVGSDAVTDEPVPAEPVLDES